MPLMTISIFDVILGCLDICLICLNKTNVVCHISTLTFMFYDSALRSGSGTRPNSPLLQFDCVWHATL